MRAKKAAEILATVVQIRPVDGDTPIAPSLRRRKELTDVAIRSARASSKLQRLYDERGLLLLVTPAGGKLWRFKYRFNRQQKTLALGAYPDVSLKLARQRRDEARELLASGIDPSAKRKAEKSSPADTFEAVAREWIKGKEKKWAPSYTRVVLSRLEQNVFPWLGAHPIGSVTPPEILLALRRVEARGAIESAHRTLHAISMVFRYAVASSLVVSDPARDLRGALADVVTRHFPAVTEPSKVGELLRILDGYKGSLIVRCALRLAPLLFVRPGELRKAEWIEINLEDARWTIPGSRMKMKQALIVPLSRQAVDALRELHPLTGDGRFVFPSDRGGDRPMSDNAILAAMRRCGIPKEEMVGHGFRAMARTILDEVLGVRVDLIEHQLGHAVKDPNGRAYNRTSFLKERTEMMQQWADYLDGLRSTGVVKVGATS